MQTKYWQQMLKYKFNTKTTNHKSNLSYKPSRWSSYLFNVRTSGYSRLNQSIDRLSACMRSAWYKSGLNFDPNRSKIEDAARLSKMFSSELFAKLYETPEELENQTEWSKQAHEQIENVLEFQSIKELVDNDADFAAYATAKLINDASMDIANFYIQSMIPKERQQRMNIDTDAINESLRSSISKSCEKLKDDLQSIAKSLKPFGWSQKDSSSNSYGSTDKQQIMNQLKDSPLFKRVVDMIGRMMENIDSLPAISKKVKEEIYDVGFGDDINMALSSETMMLSSPETEDIFYMKYLDRDLMQLETRGLEKIGRGNVFALIDQSGSMSGPYSDMAKCIAGAMAITCRNNNRLFKGVLFDNRINEVIDIDNSADSDLKILKMIESFSGGGTNFDKPLNYAINNGAFEKKADIVLITDGMCSMFEKTYNDLILAKEKGLRIFTITIGCVVNQQLKSLSDYTIDIASMDEETLYNSMAKMVRESCEIQ